MLERLKQWLVVNPPPDTLAADTALSDPAPAAVPAASGDKIVVIDVRSEREFQAVALKEAINLPLPQLEHGIRTLVADTGTPLVLYCASGARSGMACAMLRQLGYANVTNAGGLYGAAEKLQLDLRP